jgi:hypothetical protein
MTSRGFWVVAAAISAFSLWLRAGFPALSLGDTTYDDMLFIKLAGYLGSGQWLGPYNELTLAKGMFYPLFILIAFASAIPLKIAEQMLYLAACALAARFAARHAKSEPLALVLFTALAFNPVLWTGSLARVIREGIYLSLCLVVVTLVLWILFPPPAATPRKRWMPGVALGIAAAAYWTTREEGLWILPALAVPVIVIAIRLRKAGPIAARLCPLGVGVGVFAAILSLLAGMNLAHYGVFRLTDFQSGNFIRAYGALSRIEPDAWRRYAVFPRDARERAYAVSPAARELQPYLEGDVGVKWRGIGCDQSGMKDCPEILGGWFMWALRDATAKAGHYSSAVDADAFYKRLADEINTACDAGTFACLAPRNTMLPPMRWAYLADALAPGGALAVKLLHLGDGEMGVPPSDGEESILRIYSGMTGSVSPKQSAPMTVVRGWAGSPAGTPTINVSGNGATGVHTSVEILNPLLLPQPSITGTQAVPFVVTTDCPPDRCSLVLSDGVDESRIPLDALPVAKLTAGRLEIVIDSSANGHLRDKAGDPAAMRRAVQFRIATSIADFYWVAMPVLCALAVLGLCACLLSRRRHPPSWPILAFTLTSLAVVALRIALLALMDVSSIPGVNLLYASCASPFAIAFAIMGIYLAVSAISASIQAYRIRPER